MKFKRLLAAVCALAISAFAATALFGCGERDESVSITVKVPTMALITDDGSGIKDFKGFLIKAANQFSAVHPDVTVNVEEYELTNQQAAIDECFDTQYAADVHCAGMFNMISYVDRAVDFSGMLSDDIRADISENYWNYCSKGGKLHCLPYVDVQNVLAYNVEMFKECGLEQYVNTSTIQNWTIEEWESVLEGLKHNLPKGSYPLMMYAADEQGDTHVMTYLRMMGGTFYDDEYNFNVNTPEGIAALQKLKDWYAAGYFPAACENLTISDCTTLFSKGKLGISLANAILVQANFSDLNLGYVNFPSNVQNNGFATSFLTGFQVYDNGDNAKVMAAKDYVKFIYENEELLEYSACSSPVSKKVAQKHGNDGDLINIFQQNGEFVWDYTGGNLHWGEVRKVFYTSIRDMLSGQLTPAKAAERIDLQCNAAIHPQ